MGRTASQILIKQPSEILNIGMDFTALLNSGETISNPTITESPSGELDISGETVDATNNIIYFVVSGGTHGKTYRFNIKVDTSDSRIIEGDGILKIRDR